MLEDYINEDYYNVETFLKILPSKQEYKGVELIEAMYHRLIQKNHSSFQDREVSLNDLFDVVNNYKYAANYSETEKEYYKQAIFFIFTYFSCIKDIEQGNLSFISKEKIEERFKTIKKKHTSFSIETLFQKTCEVISYLKNKKK